MLVLVLVLVLVLELLLLEELQPVAASLVPSKTVRE